MNTTRRGKIARLPAEIRHQLNCRLRNGESGSDLVKWLNSLPETQSVLQTDFSGKPIREQNLSDWRKGGYAEWLSRHDVLENLKTTADEVREFNEVCGGSIVGQMSAWASSQYLAEAHRLATANANDESSWARLRELCHDLVMLRRNDLNSQRLKLEQEKLRLARTKIRNCQTDGFDLELRVPGQNIRLNPA